MFEPPYKSHSVRLHGNNHDHPTRLRQVPWTTRNMCLRAFSCHPSSSYSISFILDLNGFFIECIPWLTGVGLRLGNHWHLLSEPTSPCSFTSLDDAAGMYQPLPCNTLTNFVPYTDPRSARGRNYEGETYMRRQPRKPLEVIANDCAAFPPTSDIED